MIYRFRRDLRVILTSVLTMVLIPIVLCVIWFVEGDVKALIALPIWLLLMVCVILRTPRYFCIEHDRIVVQFFLGSKALEGIRSIRPIDSFALKGGVRLFGNGGLMGYTGYYRKHGLGNFQMLAVNRRELALVTLDNGKRYVINYPKELLNSKEL